ncbi:hypothetical protein T03_15604 [Trichinella britovi]|uniref:Retrotransposon gag domain-containing protein n=1 Tax=Trichinella britovi TaxID=45882 RepID=A0A0V1C912_TRIBR|nr:hypothetical protein T03_15604 [Trichinella britovi]
MSSGKLECCAVTINADDEDSRVNPETQADPSATPSGLLQWRDGSDGMAREVFCSVHVPKSNYCIVGRYLLSDAAWRELYPLEQTRGNTFEELKKRLLSTNGHEESPLELLVRFHGLRQRGCNQSIKLYIQEVTEFGRKTRLIYTV